MSSKLMTLLAAAWGNLSATEDYLTTRKRLRSDDPSDPSLRRDRAPRHSEMMVSAANARAGDSM